MNAHEQVRAAFTRAMALAPDVLAAMRATAHVLELPLEAVAEVLAEPKKATQ